MRIARSRNCGVTLIELLIVIAIIAVLTTIATPALGHLKQSASSRASRSALAVAVNQARISAALQRKQVVMCPSADQSRCDASIRWQHGWMVFLDDDHDNQRSDDEIIVALEQAQDDGIAILSSVGRHRIRFQPDGTADGTNLTLTVCDRRGADEARSLVLNNTGRLRNGTPSAAQARAACAAIDS
jgi:type IV fimbrial biogenesis protein FimT